MNKTEYRTIRLKVPQIYVRESGSEVCEPAQAIEVIKAYFEKSNAPRDREVFGFVALNARGKVIGVSICAIGTATAALVHPREVFRDAIAVGAISLIHFHTHPSGDPRPSSEDYDLHQRLVEGGRILGIPVLDGLVLSATNHDNFNSLAHLE